MKLSACNQRLGCCIWGFRRFRAEVLELRLLGFGTMRGFYECKSPYRTRRVGVHLIIYSWVPYHGKEIGDATIMGSPEIIFSVAAS